MQSEESERIKCSEHKLLCFLVGSGVLWEWELPVLLWAVSTGVSSELVLQIYSHN